MTWHPKVYQNLLESNYQQVAEFYERAIESEPQCVTYYWYLGLAYLLQEQEEQAQTTWLFTLSQATEEEAKAWTKELTNILESEAKRQETQDNHQLSWLIRGHIQEIEPYLINNLLYLIELEIKLGRFSPEWLKESEIIEIIPTISSDVLDEELLLKVLLQVVEFPSQEVFTFAQLSLPYISAQDQFVRAIMPIARQFGYNKSKPDWAAFLTQLCLHFKPTNLALLKELYWFYASSYRFKEALEVAYQFKQYATILPLKVFATYQILYTSISSGAWLDIDALIEEYKALLRQMVEQELDSIHPLMSDAFVLFAQPLLYFQDEISENRLFINQVSRLFETNTKQQFKSTIQLSKRDLTKTKNPLKIGYLSKSLRRHSVGWLSRWIFQYYNREAFEFIIYLVSQPEDDITGKWFRDQATKSSKFETDVGAIVNQIQQDEIDILVDLESLTSNLTCQVMALKPAPIQVTWLGMDASGIPAIDYFIADPYVLPENAQDFYQEKIWRLPNTYLAVDGFEVGYPTLRREQLNIPKEALIYLSVQNAFKLHPNTISLQMQILKAVPNSYLLIKGISNQLTLKELFTQIATQEGVSLERLRFIPLDPTEEIHRANLKIADVVLDTYPYNGATTTLELLWMGIPLVTRVGQQFAARNSYTFMVNAGISEGIAWSDEEYVEWGIRLGRSEELRQQITWKLRNSRKTAPLWNARQFTREMEKAYQQIWNNL